MISIFAVVVSLFAGLLVMGGGEEKTRLLSNKMMRFRILFQALAILFLFIAYLSK